MFGGVVEVLRLAMQLHAAGLGDLVLRLAALDLKVQLLRDKKDLVELALSRLQEAATLGRVLLTVYGTNGTLGNHVQYLVEEEQEFVQEANW